MIWIALLVLAIIVAGMYCLSTLWARQADRQDHRRPRKRAGTQTVAKQHGEEQHPPA
jgi:hypothetical protein